MIVLYFIGGIMITDEEKSQWHLSGKFVIFDYLFLAKMMMDA